VEKLRSPKRLITELSDQKKMDFSVKSFLALQKIGNANVESIKGSNTAVQFVTVVALKLLNRKFGGSEWDT
jgi:hypothetical protein